MMQYAVLNNVTLRVGTWAHARVFDVIHVTRAMFDLVFGPENHLMWHIFALLVALLDRTTPGGVIPTVPGTWYPTTS